MSSFKHLFFLERNVKMRKKKIVTHSSARKFLFFFLLTLNPKQGKTTHKDGKEDGYLNVFELGNFGTFLVDSPKKILLEPLREKDAKWLFLESLKYIYLNRSRKRQEFVWFYWSGTSKCT
jgi:hypothetical protein